jgi:hypothetical protein
MAVTRRLNCTRQPVQMLDMERKVIDHFGNEFRAMYDM